MASHRCRQLGGYDCYDGLWAWALLLLGYRFYLARDVALRVRDDRSDSHDQHTDDSDKPSSVVTAGADVVRECGCGAGLSQREVALAVEALEKWVLKVRATWEELRRQAAVLKKTTTKEEGTGE